MTSRHRTFGKLDNGLFRVVSNVLVAFLLIRCSRISWADDSARQEFLTNHCGACHGADEARGEFRLGPLLESPFRLQLDAWERVLRQVRTHRMPPPDAARPPRDAHTKFVDSLTRELDEAATAAPQRPGRTSTLRRLNRTEYQFAVRDLLALDVQAARWLPADELSLGFDTVTLSELSPTLLDRYLTAAQQISHLAVGGASRSPGGETLRVSPDITQDDYLEGLPLGTRGGVRFHYEFPRSGSYEIQVRLARDRNEHVEGLREPHELLVLLDRAELRSFTVSPPPPGQDMQHVDDHLKLRFDATAGPHDLAVTFLKKSLSLDETLRQPYRAHFNAHRHPRRSPAIYQLTVTGPFVDRGAGDTPSRRVLGLEPRGNSTPTDDVTRASESVARLARHAFRRPVTAADLEKLMKLFREQRRRGSYDEALEAALSGILMSRDFLFRMEADPPGVMPGDAYRVSEIELASRLSFFLWRSLPDEELLAAAERNELRQPEQLDRQTRRLLADPKSQRLMRDFVGQWLHLRNLEGLTPDARRYPDFDDNLRQAMRRETELLFADIARRDGSILELLRPRHIWLNERLAQHYDIPQISGPRFRPVPVDDQSERGGILRNASVLTVTSYATRTSPVLRGKWVLENLLATPPPPPAPDVPALDETSVAEGLSVRRRLEQHRAQPACAGCHQRIDPVGFTLEQFDAVGRWRDLDEGEPIDARGGLPDGRPAEGVGELEKGLLDDPDLFVTALAEKLLTFALGRAIEPSDGPAVRAIVRAARDDQYRFSSLIRGFVRSAPFTMRATSRE